MVEDQASLLSYVCNMHVPLPLLASLSNVSLATQREKRLRERVERGSQYNCILVTDLRASLQQ
jgi:hypothetical protein